MGPLRSQKTINSQMPEVDRSETRLSHAKNYSPSSSQLLKSPLRRVTDGKISKNRKLALIDNLKLEISERGRKLRSQYATQANALKQRIAMRINRVPKKLWKVTMGELLCQIEGSNSLADIEETNDLVQEVQMLSRGEFDSNKHNSLIIPKKRTTKKKTASAREKMPPPEVPSGQPRLSTSGTNLLSSSSPQESRGSHFQTSPIKILTKTRPLQKAIPSSSSSVSTRPISRATTRSSMETVATSAGSSHNEASKGTRGTKSSQAKAKAAAAAAGLKRGGVKGAGSNGSLKENRVAGVKEPTKIGIQKEPTLGGSGRVLRSRK
ncbi:hypothetical protein EDC01DRAFT_727643 [Geopyxis carbonaria]|nr:hypothetical protein EDC01DRAFT_727643 [Geopyxis carbonaria]